jgi:hypothetical protein
MGPIGLAYDSRAGGAKVTATKFDKTGMSW